MPSPSRITAIYDDKCGFCQNAMRRLRALDWLSRVDICGSSRDWLVLEARLAGRTHEEVRAEFHCLDRHGRVTRGFDAYRALAWHLPLFWPVVPLLYLPPVHWLGWRMYRWVAAHRGQLSFSHLLSSRA